MVHNFDTQWLKKNAVWTNAVWALWTSIRHDQSDVYIGLREDTHRETLTMSSCNIRETQRGRCREERERRNEPRTLN